MKQLLSAMGTSVLITGLLSTGFMTPAQAANSGNNVVTSADSAEIANASKQTKSKKVKAIEDEFILDQARQGNSIDSADIESADVDGAVVVWEDGVNVTRVDTATTDTETGPTVEMAVESEPADVEEEPSIASSGLGVENS